MSAESNLLMLNLVVHVVTTELKKVNNSYHFAPDGVKSIFSRARIFILLKLGKCCCVCSLLEGNLHLFTGKEGANMRHKRYRPAVIIPGARLSWLAGCVQMGE